LLFLSLNYNALQIISHHSSFYFGFLFLSPTHNLIRCSLSLSLSFFNTTNHWCLSLSFHGVFRRKTFIFHQVFPKVEHIIEIYPTNIPLNIVYLSSFLLYIHCLQSQPPFNFFLKKKSVILSLNSVWIYDSNLLRNIKPRKPNRRTRKPTKSKKSRKIVDGIGSSYATRGLSRMRVLSPKSD
jgi:hypothetical protein